MARNASRPKRYVTNLANQLWEEAASGSGGPGPEVYAAGAITHACRALQFAGLLNAAEAQELIDEHAFRIADEKGSVPWGRSAGFRASVGESGTSGNPKDKPSTRTAMNSGWSVPRLLGGYAVLRSEGLYAALLGVMYWGDRCEVVIYSNRGHQSLPEIEVSCPASGSALSITSSAHLAAASTSVLTARIEGLTTATERFMVILRDVTSGDKAEFEVDLTGE